MKTTFNVLAIAVALIAAASGCQTLTGRTVGELVDNKTVQAAVKAKLVGDRVQNLTWVHVDANDGVVYLTGNAETAAHKARATELALQTHGVRRVVNNIVVNSAKTDTASAPARPAAAASASSTARSSTTAPSASPATTTSARAGSGSISGEVVTVDQGTGDVTLRMAGGSDQQLRLPPSSVKNVKPGDRLSVSVNAVAR
jgi:hyperosmotically inducible periplasmic protein